MGTSGHGPLAWKAGLLRARRLGCALAIRRLDSAAAAASDGVARFAMCFMLVVSCNP